jgi:predicted transcriptional regulator
MDYLWTSGEARTVRDVQGAAAPELAYTTVMTTLDRLHKKGLLDRQRQGRGFVYVTRLSRAGFHERLLRPLLRALLGLGDARPVLTTLVDSVGAEDRKLLNELERLVRRKREELRGKAGTR